MVYSLMMFSLSFEDMFPTFEERLSSLAVVGGRSDDQQIFGELFAMVLDLHAIQTSASFTSNVRMKRKHD
eukprot:6490877-Amphidinium_carterae.2